MWSCVEGVNLSGGIVCSYRVQLLKPCTKALTCSTKISVRVDHRGFLSLQCMVLTEDRQTCFVEFLVSPPHKFLTSLSLQAKNFINGVSARMSLYTVEPLIKGSSKIDDLVTKQLKS